MRKYPRAARPTLEGYESGRMVPAHCCNFYRTIFFLRSDPLGLSFNSTNAHQYFHMLQTYEIPILQGTIFIHDRALSYIAIPFHQLMYIWSVNASHQLNFGDHPISHHFTYGYGNYRKTAFITVSNLKKIHIDSLLSVVESAIFRVECVVEDYSSHNENVLWHWFAYVVMSLTEMFLLQ